MPRISKNITTDARISVSSHYLKRSGACELLLGKYDFNTPGLCFKGTVITTNNGPDGNIICEVRLDDLPDHIFKLFGNSLKYEGPRTSPAHVPEPLESLSD
ncbi:hypothetical protein K7432_016305 [Basidiobolus ranarum]|uniref:Uncharacterized protein n=1 Tax=Basidiobolus ranarum TaxID=34480 RepID=A0ABR2VLT4_9FUNG